MATIKHNTDEVTKVIKWLELQLPLRWKQSTTSTQPENE